MKEKDRERANCVRWECRARGLIEVEAERLVDHPAYLSIVDEHEAWRSKNGFPARDSPIARGHILDLVKARSPNRSTQKCVKCGEPSIPGLVAGHGVCSYHWAEGCWGRAWADECYPNRAEERRKAMNEKIKKMIVEWFPGTNNKGVRAAIRDCKNAAEIRALPALIAFTPLGRAKLDLIANAMEEK